MSHLVTRRVLPALGAAALAAVPAAAAATPTATPAGVPVTGGQTSLKLDKTFSRSLKRLRLKVRGGRFTVTGGSITTPATDAGAVTQRGSLALTLGRTTVTLSDPVATFGRPASLAFGRARLPLSGGRVTRSGFDAGLAGAKVKLDTVTAKVLNRAFKVRVFRKGQTLGSLTTTEKLGGIVTAGGTTSVALSTTTSQRLVAGGIVASAIAPAAVTVTPGGPTVSFAVARGSILTLGANGIPVGKLLNQGGLVLNQASSGKSVTTTNYTVDTTINPPKLLVNLTAALAGPFADLQPSSPPTVNPKARTITLTGITATLDPVAAALLDQQFPSAGFAAGDLIGIGAVTIQAR